MIRHQFVTSSWGVVLLLHTYVYLLSWGAFLCLCLWASSLPVFSARLLGTCLWAYLIASSLPVLSGRVFTARVSGLVSARLLCPSSLGASSRRLCLGFSLRVFSARPLWARLLGACLWASSLRLSLRLYVLYLRLFAFTSAYQLSWRCTCVEFNLGSYCPTIECLSTCVSRQWLLRRSIRPEV